MSQSVVYSPTFAPPPGHLLALPRTIDGAPAAPGAIDVSTTSAHDFDVDAITGFMPPQPPIARLPPPFEPWEHLLKAAIDKQLLPYDHPRYTDAAAAASASWRSTVDKAPLLDTTPLHQSETDLRRAHVVLAFLLSFYAHTAPRPPADAHGPIAPLRIPAAIGVPLVAVSAQLGIAPVVTYADTVLWNVSAPMALAPSVNLLAPPSPTPAAPEQLTVNTLFSGTHSEAHFYTTSARIELAGARALAAMERTLDEVFLSDAIALRRIPAHLRVLAGVLDEMTVLLKSMRDGCDPGEFYHDIRPWFRGGESWPGGGGWLFEDVPEGPEAERARWSTGASAGQSTLIHALDVFLCTENTASAYLARMQGHMPRHHRAFLAHLRAIPDDATLRALVAGPRATPALRETYNAAVRGLRAFRDAHMGVASRYILKPAKERAPEKKTIEQGAADLAQEGVKGTGGTDLVPFLKGLRDGTERAVIS